MIAASASRRANLLEGRIAAVLLLGVTAGDLVLVRMNVKHKSRQVQVGQVGTLGANAGIATREQVEVVRNQIAPGLYSLTPAAPLKRGEYGFYLFRGYDLPGYIYDFGVE